jgi:hypothetical protein
MESQQKQEYGIVVTPAFYRVNALRDDQRDAAYERARQRIAGRKPTQTEFMQQRIDKYPRSFVIAIVFLSGLMLIAAYLPSAMRIHSVALENYGQVITQEMSKYVAALCIVLMSETGQIVFSLASATSEQRKRRIGFAFGALVCTAIALSGNAVASGAHATQNAFAFLETFAPPVLTLITAEVLKSQALNAIADRHRAHTQYEIALDAWQRSITDAENDAAWKRTLANVLKDALRDANKRSHAVLRELTQDDWYALTMRERHALEWVDAAEQRLEQARQRLATQTEAQTQSGGHSTGATGEVAAQTIAQSGDAYVIACPHCAREFEGTSERHAQMRLTAHMKAHKNEQRRLTDTMNDSTARARGEAG